VNTYDVYGNPGSANAGTFQYTGQMYMPLLGLYYYRARYYSPVLGRFLQTDPVGYKDDLDLYTYVGDDPDDKTDPTGNAFLLDDAAGVVVGGLINLSIQGWKDIYSLATGGGGGTYGESAGAFTSGAVAGVAAVNVPETGGLSSAVVIGGAASGAGNIMQQAVDTGHINGGEVAAHTIIGAILGPLAAKFLPAVKVTGVSAGSNSMKAVGEAVKTKLANGTATDMSVSTAAKVTAGTAVNEAARTATADAGESGAACRSGGNSGTTACGH
jgi:RHS repeat-associated protein